jgi:O-antigen ligase
MRIKIPYLTTNLQKDIIITLYLAPLWWVLGVSIFIYHAVTIWLFLKLMIISINNHERIRIARPVRFLILITIIYGISLVINYPKNEIQRTMASLYNYSFWVMGLVLIVVIHNSFDMGAVKKLTAPLRFNVITIGILATIFVIFWLSGHKEIEYKSLLLSILPGIGQIPLLKASTTLGFVHTDWFAFRPLPRIEIMAPHGPAVAALIILMTPIAATYYSSRKSGSYWAIIFLGLFSLLATLARSATLALVIAICTVYLFNKRHRLMFLMLSVSLIIFTLPLLEVIVEWFSSLRSGSSSSRFMVYEETLRLIKRENILIGIGVKPRESDISIPIGSHSMYLGMLLKTGLLGLLSFILFQINIIKTWFRLIKEKMKPETRDIFNHTGVSLIAASLFLFTQDLDAPQLVAFLYFLMIGILTVISKEVLSRNVENV